MYSFVYKMRVVEYTKQNGNRATERHFGLPSMEKYSFCYTIDYKGMETRRHIVDKRKRTFQLHATKWLQLEAELKNTITDHKGNGISII